MYMYKYMYMYMCIYHPHGCIIALHTIALQPWFLCRFVMEKVDLVMVGAEGVAESGGIINKVSGVQVIVTFHLVSWLFTCLDWDLPASGDG